MTCPACAAAIPDNSTFCPQCGKTIQSAASAVVHAEFVGTAMQLLGWILLTIVSACVVIPLAWVYAAMGRWFCRNLKLSDGTTAAFKGTGGQVVGWVILYMVVAIGFQVANRMAAKEGIGLVLLLLVVYIVAISAIALQLINWYVSSVELSPGGALAFTGTYGGLLGWYLLVVISVYSIIGWAWASAAMYRWFARNTRGEGVEFQFHGKGHQILWRVLVYVLTCILIIPIPWMALWLTRWLIQNVTMTRVAAPA